MKIKRLAAIALIVVTLAAMATISFASASSSGTVEFEGTTNVEFGDGTTQGVPDFNFGTGITITGNSHTLPDTQTDASKQFIKIADLRGSGAGWSLRLKASQFRKSGIDTLTGATITFSIPQSNAAIRQMNGVGAAALEVGSGSGTNTLIRPTSNCTTAITLQCSSSSGLQKIITADPNHGMGFWWFKPSATLNVIAGTASTGSHESTLTWELSNVPA